MKFSIIIPIRALNSFVQESVDHIKALTYKDFEVLIVTDEVEANSFADAKVKLLVSGKVGPGEKRNFAAKAAIGEVLAFLDDDAYPATNWLDEAAKLFSDASVFALGGPAVTPPTAGFLEKCAGKILESTLASAGTRYRHRPEARRAVADYPSVNLFVRKEAFAKVGGYSIEFWPGEDTKLCLDLVKAYGRPFGYDPRPIVYHHRRNVFIPYLKQISRYGRHRGQFARIFPETSRLPSYFAPSIFTLGLTLGPIFALVEPGIWYVYFFCLLGYLCLLAVEMVKVLLAERSLKIALHVGAGIFLTHIVYGVNFIVGIIAKPKLKLRSVDSKTRNYIGG